MIRLLDLAKDFLTEAQMPKVLYHSVKNEQARDFVLQNGIKADENSMVYLSTKPVGGLYKFTFEVKVPDMNKLHDWREVWSDSDDKEYDPANPYFVYEGDIPAKYVKLTANVPPVLYHATYKPLLNKIKQDGLDTTKSKKAWEDSKPGLVYLATDLDVAASYAESSDMVPDSYLDNIIVLHIDTSKLDSSKLSVDKNVQDNAGDTLEYSGVIPFSAITKITKYD